MNLDNSKIIDRLEAIEALAQLIIKEATVLKKSLSPVQERAPRKGRGLTSAAKAQLLARRMKTIIKKSK